MSYIDQEDYNNLLKNFAKGTPKGLLQENYIDLRPIGTFEGVATSMGSVYKQYDNATSMEEAEEVGMRSVKAGIDKNPKVTKADFIPAAKKNEGLNLPSDDMQATGPTIQTVEGHQLKNLSQPELEELKNYIESVKITNGAIRELLNKAKTPKMESGDNTEKDIQLNQPTDTPEQPAANITPGGQIKQHIDRKKTKPDPTIPSAVGPKGYDY